MFTRRAYSESKSRTRKVGGRLLGEGVTGQTFNAACISSGNSFCKRIRGQEESISKIVLYTPNTSPVKLTKEEDVSAFIDYFRNLDGIISKILKPPPKFLKKSIQTLFHNELDANRRIIKLYGSNAEKFLTIAPIDYNGHQVIGAQVFGSSMPPMYVIFGYKCNNKFKIDTTSELKRWVKDILKSLEILQKANYLHNDIKPDNTVLCKEVYKLIDWGFACHMDYKAFKKSDGDDMFISPARWYIVGVPKDKAIEKLKSKTERKNKSLYHSSIWNECMEFLENELEYVYTSGLSHEQLFTKYKKSFDVMMIGFTIVEVVYDSNLSWTHWKPIVFKFLSHKHPINAAAALLVL